MQQNAATKNGLQRALIKSALFKFAWIIFANFSLLQVYRCCIASRCTRQTRYKLRRTMAARNKRAENQRLNFWHA
jgi:hypothetical protein